MIDPDSKKLLENVIEQDVLLSENITSTMRRSRSNRKQGNALTYSRCRADHRTPSNEPRCRSPLLPHAAATYRGLCHGRLPEEKVQAGAFGVDVA